MKAAFSAEYWAANKERMLEWIPGEDYVNLEAELERRMNVYNGIGLPEIAIRTIKKAEAKKIAERCRGICMREMKTIKEIEAGEASLGYVTQRQEIEARSDLKRRFEFNCWQLSEFKKAYGI